MVSLMRSRKKTAMMAAVITGYVKRMVEATPAGIRWKLRYRVSDESMKSTPRAVSVRNSRRSTLRLSRRKSITMAIITHASPKR